jgi:Fic family protein
MTTQTKEEPRNFKHIDLRLVVPAYESELTDLIMDLEHLRKLRVTGTTPRQIFFQIKNIFHILESIGSARIEGNRTTVVEYIDNKIETNPSHSDSIKEIENMENCLPFIDENVGARPIDRAFVSELHKMVVAALSEEGSKSPGEYRNHPVKIHGSTLVPPPPFSVPGYMSELFDFIAKADAPKYDLLRIALAHHRFVWIHPFDNGNGRTVRLFTYAMMVKLGFGVHVARILNPTAVFCYDREQYYAALSRADQGDNEGYLLWTLYMLSGLKREIEKTDKLSDYDYLTDKILMPTINYSLEKNIINENETKILCLAVQKREIGNADIRGIFPGKSISDVSRMIRSLLDQKYLTPMITNSRKYSINFRENRLLRGVIFALDKAEFLPSNE